MNPSDLQTGDVHQASQAQYNESPALAGVAECLSTGL